MTSDEIMEMVVWKTASGGIEDDFEQMRAEWRQFVWAAKLDWLDSVIALLLEVPLDWLLDDRQMALEELAVSAMKQDRQGASLGSGRIWITLLGGTFSFP